MRDERHKLIEVNLRPPMTQRLYRAAGVNFSRLAHLDCACGISEVVAGYQTDVYWIDLFMDPPGWIRWRRVESRERGTYFRPYFARRVFNIRPLSDPIPVLVKALTLAKQAPYYLKSRRDRVAGPILSSQSGPATAAHQSVTTPAPVSGE
jgi:predicted ATP-grasp superfamily ATP-dependent carboligase